MQYLHPVEPVFWWEFLCADVADTKMSKSFCFSLCRVSFLYDKAVSFHYHICYVRYLSGKLIAFFKTVNHGIFSLWTFKILFQYFYYEFLNYMKIITYFLYLTILSEVIRNSNYSMFSLKIFLLPFLQILLKKLLKEYFMFVRIESMWEDKHLTSPEDRVFLPQHSFLG